MSIDTSVVRDVFPHYVNSSNLAAAGYADKVLYIRFRNGACYAYDGASETTLRALVGAESAGKYFNSVIKPNLTCRRLSHDPFQPTEVNTLTARSISGAGAPEPNPSKLEA